MAAIALTVSCSAEQAPRESQAGANVRSEREAWYAKQVAQDCPPTPGDVDALKAVQRAHAGDRAQKVYGPPDPYKRRWPALDALKTRPNPRGAGTIVTAWQDSNRGFGADFSRRRAAWLVLNGTVYPLNVDAAGALSRLFDGMPLAIQKQAGLSHDFTPGRTMLDQIGLEEHTYVRRGDGVNPFPQCR